MRIIKKFCINIILFSVFTIPQVFRTHHIFTVHHNTNLVEQKFEYVKYSIHNVIEHCPIHEYSFNIPDKVEDGIILCKSIFYTTKITSDFTKKEKHNQLFFFYLRAPPYQSL